VLFEPAQSGLCWGICWGQFCCGAFNTDGHSTTNFELEKCSTFCNLVLEYSLSSPRRRDSQWSRSSAAIASHLLCILNILHSSIAALDAVVTLSETTGTYVILHHAPLICKYLTHFDERKFSMLKSSLDDSITQVPQKVSSNPSWLLSVFLLTVRLSVLGFQDCCLS
jgi:hypothetical protein